MATAKKTPSGMWKVRVYSHTTPDGKKHYRAFTAPTKQEAEQMAAKFSGSHDRAARCDLTVAEAIKGYIDAKEAVLSPSTIREYRRMQNKNYEDIGHEKIRNLNNERMQRFVSDMFKTVSAKTTRNAYMLLTAAVALYMPDMTFRVTLPARTKRRPAAPSDAQIMALYDAASGWMQVCIALAAFGSLRRGEICALRYGDIDGCVVKVTRDIVQAHNREWVIKDMPKTSDSVRDVVIPKEVVDLIGSGDPAARIINKNPNTVTLTFIRLRDSLGLDIRFHDLRHYFASIGAVLGVPDIYLASFGGWRVGSSVMKEVYQNKMTDASNFYASAMSAHFRGMLKSMT